MQLTHGDLNAKLLVASYTLLTTSAQSEAWNVNTAIMYYGERDRVTAIEAVVQGSKGYENGQIFSSKFVIDTLTGASATGIVPQNQAQTYTRPSGNGSYRIAENETPLDDTFKDTRAQLSAQWTQPSGKSFNYSMGMQASREYDYQSVVTNGSLGKFLNNKNTEISIGAAVAVDRIKPVGGAPVTLSSMVLREDFASEEAFRQTFRETRGKDSKNKTTIDFKLGLTQIISRRWITQFNLGVSEVDGYQTDPYKLISYVNSDGSIIDNRYESRPEKRSKKSFFAQSKYHFKSPVLDTSYRLARDDWGISSHTLDARIHFIVSDRSSIAPHLRYYRQSEADFYTPFFLDEQLNTNLPDYASADYRIGKLNAVTIGAKYQQLLKDGRGLGVRLEYYQQTPKPSDKPAPGQLEGLDLYPKVSALIFQVNYDF